MLLEYCLYVRNDNYQQESKEGDSSESGNELTLLSGQGTESDQIHESELEEYEEFSKVTVDNWNKSLFS